MKASDCLKIAQKRHEDGIALPIRKSVYIPNEPVTNFLDKNYKKLSDEDFKKNVLNQSDTVQSDTVQSDTVQSDTVQSDTVQSDTVQSDTVQSDTVQIQTLGKLIANAFPILKGDYGLIKTNIEYLDYLLGIENEIPLRYHLTVAYFTQLNKSKKVSREDFEKNTGVKKTSRKMSEGILAIQNSGFFLTEEGPRNSVIYTHISNDERKFRLSSSKLIHSLLPLKASEIKTVLYYIKLFGHKYGRPIKYKPWMLARNANINERAFVKKTKELIEDRILLLTGAGEIFFNYTQSNTVQSDTVQSDTVQSDTGDTVQSDTGDTVQSDTGDTVQSDTVQSDTVQSTPLGKREKNEEKKLSKNSLRIFKELSQKERDFFEGYKTKSRMEKELATFDEMIREYDRSTILVLANHLMIKGDLKNNPCGNPMAYLASGAYDQILQRYNKHNNQQQAEESKKQQQEQAKEQAILNQEEKTRNNAFNLAAVASNVPKAHLDQLTHFYATQGDYDDSQAKFLAELKLSLHVIEKLTGGNAAELIDTDLTGLIASNKTKVQALCLEFRGE